MDADTVLSFWFEESTPEQWYKKNGDFDQTIRERYGAAHSEAVSGTLDHWAETPDGCLALIILLDQFSRNMYRDDPGAFAADPKALALTKAALEKGWVESATSAQAQFLLMPLMHSEDLADQEMSIPLFAKFCGEKVADFAIRHRDIITRFGRFPHRNAVLSRESTQEEIGFLKTEGSSF
ncbi:MAG: DUF924 domain-containing protein [Rhodospirillales bacterium]|jgi:uncharacterized protein (DUF924 family)|nr:DUF924 domain-containing protein [Rhodospirillales bacterium]